MVKINRRRLPAGIQSFNKIRKGNYLYVDKTDIVWNLVNNGDQFNYMSRPRRFGKSVLVDTLQMYLEGRKELFEGLRIMELEEEWNQHPVIRLDMSRGGAELFLYQSGYLTIKSVEGNVYHLGFPNEDVKQALYDCGRDTPFIFTFDNL